MATTRAVLNVPSISCNHCKMAIENAVDELDVDSVLVDVGEKTVTVEFETGAITLEDVEAAVTGEGYEVAGRHVFEG